MSDPVCYICNDGSTETPLIPSPCGQCQMHVHETCFHTHQIYLFQSFKCVLVHTGESSAPFVAYTVCSICKKRYEYTSPQLIHTLTQKMVQSTHNVSQQAPPTDRVPHSHNDLQREDDVDHDVHLLLQCVTYWMRIIPYQLRYQFIVCAQKIMLAIAHAPLESMITSIQNTIFVIQCAIYMLSTSIVVVGAHVVHNTLWSWFG